MRIIKISNLNHPNNGIFTEYADSFLSKLRGLMLRKELQENEGIVLVENSESILNSSIHMLFMNFDIGVLWLDSSKKVCDKVYAKKWRIAYLSQKPAQYTVEIHPSRLNDFAIGDQLLFSDEN